MKRLFQPSFLGAYKNFAFGGIQAVCYDRVAGVDRIREAGPTKFLDGEKFTN